MAGCGNVEEWGVGGAKKECGTVDVWRRDMWRKDMELGDMGGACVGVATRPGLCPIAKETA